ncbi:unnamed protein product, partial [Cladocopium goreaui]
LWCHTNTARPRGGCCSSGVWAVKPVVMPGGAGVPTGALAGTVKSWNGMKGCVAAATQGKTCRVQVHWTSLLTEELQSGRERKRPEEWRNVHSKFMTGTVDFKAQQGSDGRYKASMVSVPFAEGWPVVGRIKSYSEKHGYGILARLGGVKVVVACNDDMHFAGQERFIVSSQMNQDIRFDRNVIDVPATPALQGQLVVVDIAIRPDGKYNASRVSLQENPRMGPMPPAAPAATPYVNGNRMPPIARGSAEHQGLNSMVGIVKAFLGSRFNLRAGMGCLTVSGYAGDVAFSALAALTGTLADASDPGIIVGSMVSFSPSNTDGRLWANNVPRKIEMSRAVADENWKNWKVPWFVTTRMLLIAAIAQVLPIASSTHSAPGIVKRPMDLSSARAGADRWKKPRTHEVATGQYASGQIKTYSEQKGFGFIRSDGLAEDVFFLRTSMPEECAKLAYRDTAGTELVGCTVNFELVKTVDGRRGSPIEISSASGGLCSIGHMSAAQRSGDLVIWCILHWMT